MNWFGGELRVKLCNGTTLGFFDVPFTEDAITKVLDERVRPGMVTEIMYLPYPTCVDIPPHHKAAP